jgi:dihydropteroate synthase
MALEKTNRLLQEGAKFIDIGGYSSRPGAAEISITEEMDRVVPVIEAIHKAFPDAILSIDTFRAAVAEHSIHAGAQLINDISGGVLDEGMFEMVAKLQVPYILMHMKGTPQTMHKDPFYQDITLEVVDYFSDKIAALKALGVKDIILDPGFGFAKNTTHNYKLLQEMGDLHIFGLPLLVGFSRKAMVYKTLGITPQEALNGTTVLNTIALLKGATLLRVHDVKEAAECVALVQKMQQN